MMSSKVVSKSESVVDAFLAKVEGQTLDVGNQRGRVDLRVGRDCELATDVGHGVSVTGEHVFGRLSLAELESAVLSAR